MEPGQALNLFFPWKNASHLSGHLTCVRKLGDTGEFAFAYLVASAVRAGKRVVLFSLKYNYSHYEAVLRKVGIPSETISALVSVVPVPLPELPEAHIQASIVSARVIKLQLSAMTRAGVSIQQGHLEQVYAVLNEKVESSDGPLCVCLDDLSLIELLYGIDAAAKLLRRLHGLTARYSEFCLVIFGEHSSVHSDIMSYAMHRADTVVTVQPLETGFSRDAHGQLLISTRMQLDPTENFQPTILFKTSETGVRCTSLGRI